MEANRYRGMRALLAAFLVVFAILALAGAAFAQRETGSITGTITDPTGAVISGAQITLRNLNTNAARTATSSATGAYSFTMLPPGPYELDVQMAGFGARKIQTTVTVGSSNTLDAKLEMMTEKTTVEVFGEAAVEVETRSQEVSNVVNTQQIDTLPSLTRNPYDFATTVPNVSNSAGSDSTYANTYGIGVNINGQRSSSTDILLDGGENVDLFSASTGQAVPLDSVQEFRIVTSDFGAEYGRASGGVVNVATKSGTNDFHGTVYEFNRLSAYTSNTYANAVNGTPKPGYTRNQFGWSVGGPVVKNKLFFFNSVEFIRVRSASAFQALIADPQMLAASAPNTQSFFNAWGQPALTPTRGYTYCDLFYANEACVAPDAASFPNLAAYDPTGATRPLLGAYTFTAPANSGGGDPQNTYMIVGRVDWNATDKTTVYGRYALQNLKAFPGANSFSPYPQFNTPYSFFNQNALASVTHIFTPNLVSQTKITFNRLTNMQPLSSIGDAPTLYMNDVIPVRMLNTDVYFPGYLPTGPGFAIPFGGPQNLAQFFQDFSWSKGKHQFKFGGQYVYTQDNRAFGAYEGAVEGLTFSSVDNQLALDNLLAGKLGVFEVAVDPQGKFPCYLNATSGDPIQTPGCTLDLPLKSPSFSRSNRFHDFALYGQDSWKLHPRFTLNLGIRWEYYGVQHNKNQNLDSNFYLGSTGCPATVPNCPGFGLPNSIANGSVLTVPNSPDKTLWEPSYTNFGPRIGFAWDVFGNGKTSLRGGWGISYERNFGNVTFNIIQNPPNYAVPQFTLDPLIDANNLGPMSGTGQAVFGNPSLRAVKQNIATAYAETWSLTLEREVFKNSLLSVGYSGSRGVHLYDMSNWNQRIAGCLFVGYSVCDNTGDYHFGRTDLQYGSINYRGDSGFSTYHALITSFRTSNLFNTGFSFNANYTWSHAIDNISDVFSSSANMFNLGYIDPFHPNLDKGAGDVDTRHRFVFSGIWDLPFGKNTSNSVLKHVIGGWTIAPIFTARTGLPFTVWDCGNTVNNCVRPIFDSQPGSNHTLGDPINNGGNSYTLMNLPSGTSVEGPAFMTPIFGWPVSDFGECPSMPSTVFPCAFPANMTRRNSFVGPSWWNMDMGIYKNFKLTERFNLQFRSEFYNIFNHHNFYVDGAGGTEIDCYTYGDGTCGSSLFGPSQVTGVKGGFGTSADDRRYIQFALKLTF